MSDDVLVAKNITVEYKIKQGLFNSFTHKALDNVSFSVKKGEVLGVLGRNGAGKSTLLKILSGVMSPDSGEVIIPKGVTRSLLTLGLGFNNDLTGRDNVILSAMFNGYSKKEAKLVSEEIKEFSELGKFYEQPVKTYSSGMRSKLGFSSAMLTNVDILLIDEVLAVGDKHFREKAESALTEKVKSDEQTVLFVSHSENQIKRICDRCIILPSCDDFQFETKNKTDVGSTGNIIKESDRINQGLEDAKMHIDIISLLLLKDYNTVESLIGDNPSELKNIAISLEKVDINKAKYFMEKALVYRPDSSLIKKKLEEYHEVINGKENN